MAQALSVDLVSDVLFTVGGIPITNSVFTAFAVSVVLIVFALWMRKGMGLIPSRTQVAVEAVVMNFYESLIAAYGSEKRARKYLPYFVTLFLFLLLMNQLSLFPFVFDLRLGSEPLIAGVPFLTKPDTGMSLFHASTADWSQTLTLALMTVIGTQIIAFSIHPIRHIGNYIKIQRFFRIKSPMDILFGLVDILLGVLEFAGDLAKVVSLSARLFGNLFAGEVMVMVFVKVVFPFFAATPIILLGILSAIVQAYVFTFLSLQFMAGTVEAARGEA